MEKEVQKTEEVQSEAPQINVEEVLSRVEKLESTNQRLLDESKSWKSKYTGLQENIEKEQKVKLEEGENWKELLDLEKSKAFELASQVKDLKKKQIQSSLQFKVASLAKDAYDVSDVIKSLPKDLLSLDEESGEVKGVEDAYNAVRESKPYLFDTAKKSGMPSGRPDDLLKPEKTPEEMISENPKGMLNAALKDLLT